MISAKLRLIEKDDIQLLRFWRNLDHIKNQMVNSDIICYQDQKKWFNNLDDKHSKYFIYSFNEKDVGNVKISKIDYKMKTFEAGILCGDISFLDHWINIWACIKIYDYAFNDLKLLKSYAIIKKNNFGALRLNKSLGYVFIKELDNNLEYLSLEKDSYMKASHKIKKYLKNIVNTKF